MKNNEIFNQAYTRIIIKTTQIRDITLLHEIESVIDSYNRKQIEIEVNKNGR